MGDLGDLGEGRIAEIFWPACLPMPPGRKALFTFRVRGETVGAITVTSTPGESRVRTSQIGLATEQESTSQARALMITLNNLSIDDAAALFFCV